MDREAWKRKIRKCCRDAGTYKKFFEPTIDSLAGILEMRDAAQEQYEAEGSIPVIEHTNQAGATNPAKNPKLLVVLDCNTQALSYWRELGLTSKSWKGIMTGESLGTPKAEGLEGALSSLGI